MKSILVALCLSVFLVSANPLGENNENRLLFEAIGDTGEVCQIDISSFAEQIHQNKEATEINPKNIYSLYTRQNPSYGQRLVLDEATTIIESNFKPGQPVVVIAHGWLGSESARLNTVIRNAFLSYTDSNIIVLDWSHYAQRDYLSAMIGIPSVGKALGQFLLYLSNNFGVRLEDMHLTGFSLGAHVVGNAGRFLDGRVGRITGMDPAGPVMNSSPNGLKSTDAIYVEAMITNGANFDMSNNIIMGDTTFYSNDGENQPGCFTSVCNHNRAWELFAATVTYNHLFGKECFTDAEVRTDQCNGKTMNMGNGLIGKTGFGRFRVNTSKNYPYN